MHKGSMLALLHVFVVSLLPPRPWKQRVTGLRKLFRWANGSSSPRLNQPLTGVGHQWTVSTSTGCNQWFSLAKAILKVAFASRNHSLVVNTSTCGWAIRRLLPTISRGATLDLLKLISARWYMELEWLHFLASYFSQLSNPISGTHLKLTPIFEWCVGEVWIQ